jgi:hypothetical protein
LCHGDKVYIGCYDPLESFRVLVMRQIGGEGKGGLGHRWRGTQSSIGICDRGCDPHWWGTVLRVATACDGVAVNG